MDLRAKLDRIRSMEPPAALFEPPPWAAAIHPPPTAAERMQQLSTAMGLAARSSDTLPEPEPEPEPRQHSEGARPDLRRKLARLRSLNPPPAPSPSTNDTNGSQQLQAHPGQDTRTASEPADTDRKARLRKALLALQHSQLVDIAPQPSAAEPIGAPSAQQAFAPFSPERAFTHEAPEHTAPEQPPSEPSAQEDARKARLRAAFRALQRSQQRSSDEAAVQLRAATSFGVAEAGAHTHGQCVVPPPAALSLPPLAALPLPPLAAPPPDAQDPPAKQERISKLRALIADVTARDRLRTPPPPAAPTNPGPPPWLQEPTEHGPLHVCTRYLEPDHHHGHSAVRAALYEQPGTIPSLVCDETFAGIDLSRALYLDTETTGLAGGTGTVAFLVGLAFFEDESLRVEQLIVPQLGSETPVLARLAERIAAASCLITYNGKSFDWPLLRTRFVLSRLPVPAVPPHIDLLHVCRRVWKPRLPSVRLVDMERELLRFERHDDLPGSEIPARYFEFLRGGSPDRLCPVLEHNQNDLIALAALLGAVMAQYTGERTLCSPTDALHYGKLALRARDLERARSFGQDALSSSSDCHRQARAALTLCAEIEHKLGRIPEAIACLERAVEHAQQLSDEVDALAQANLHFTLAKLYEHEQHDLVRALRHARNTELAEGPLHQGRRLGRLVRRLQRSS